MQSAKGSVESGVGGGVEEEREVGAGEGAIIPRHSSLDRGLLDSCWKKMSSLCHPVVHRTWVLKESVTLFRLTLPLVSLLDS